MTASLDGRDLTVTSGTAAVRVYVRMADIVRTKCQGPDVRVLVVSLENIAKTVRVLVTVPHVCMEDTVWRKMEGLSPAPVRRDIQESSVRFRWMCAIPTLATRGYPVTAQRADTCVPALKVTMVTSV